MKQTLLSLIFSFSFFFFSCENKSSEKNTIISDIEATFKELVKRENDDFYKKDFNIWSKNFAQNESVYWICVEDDVTLRASGWKDLKNFVSTWMKENPLPEVSDNDYGDFSVVVADSLAFVKYKKTIRTKDKAPKVMLEHRTFQKIENEWKVIGMTSAPGYDSKGSSSNVFMHNAAL